MHHFQGNAQSHEGTLERAEALRSWRTLREVSRGAAASASLGAHRLSRRSRRVAPSRRPLCVHPWACSAVFCAQRRLVRDPVALARTTAGSRRTRAARGVDERAEPLARLARQARLSRPVWEPRVSDFGLARSLGTPSFADFVAVQGGTRGWMSPEHARGDSLTTASWCHYPSRCTESARSDWRKPRAGRAGSHGRQ